MHPYEKIPLNTIGYILAAWLIALHLWMLLKPTESKNFLIKLPRNKTLGPWLMGAGMLWFWLLVAPDKLGIFSKLQMDLGEFNQAKNIMRILVPVAAAGMIMHVKEFLTVRAIGLLALMAQSGMPIPADPESRIPVYDQICADIGDEQSIEQTLSTFSWHLGNIVRILHDTTAESLVLLDELGASTDPAEGAALAQAVLGTFLTRGTSVVATTGTTPVWWTTTTVW